MSGRVKKVGLIVGALLVAYMVVGVFHIAIVSYLMYTQFDLGAEGWTLGELMWCHVKEVWPLVAWPYDAMRLYIFNIG